MISCCLCSKLSSGMQNEVWDKPLLETKNFVVLPSLGSLVPGWLLLIPKTHFVCMGALSPDLATEMDRLKQHLALQVSTEYGNACVFEHGPSRANKSIGCGVDHAHVHVVPVGFDLAEAARVFMPNDAAWRRHATWNDCQTAFAQGHDYLYVEQPLGSGVIAVDDDFGSQVFRKAIAAHLGELEKFNWRDYPRLDLIATTVRRWNDATQWAVSF